MAYEPPRSGVETPVAGWFDQIELDPTEGGADPVNPLAAQLLPEPVCRHFTLLPVSVAGGEVVLAAANPWDALGLEVARTLSPQPLRVVVAPPDQVERAIDRVYAGLAEMPEAVAPGRGRLGELLLARGQLSTEQLDWALEVQERTGSRLGEILVHEELVPEADVAAALAEQLSVPLLDLEGVDPDPAALAVIPEVVQRGHRCVPIAVDADALYLVIADPLDDEAYAELREHTDLPIRIYVAPQTAVESLLRRVHEDEYIRAARTELLTRFPEDCANRVLSGGQRAFFILAAIAIVVGFVLAPLETAIVLTVISVLIYTGAALYKFFLFYEAFGRRRELVIGPDEIAAIDERDLPVYTILVPLYREAEVLPRLVANLDALDYPRAKLEVLLLAEEDDEETIEAITSMGLAPHFKLVVVPDSQPKTKPKACNFGLTQANGRYVVIFDAEDQPDTDQLKKVYAGFERVDDSVVCIQCKLNYFNTDQNFLTRFFSTEYALWFDLLLPGLDASGAPIPLGGTSNHFDRDVLLEIGAWDPFNVTEDADLGMRLHKDGYKTAMLDSTTLEEANSALPNWLRQRSRWVKGYLQTYLVHMRHPFSLLREIGLKSFISFQFIVGGTVIFLLNPIFWALTTLFFLTQAGIIRDLFPGFVYYLASFQLFVGNFVFTYLAVAGTMQRRLYSLTKFALFSPVYWGLMSIGAYRGFFQLMTRPFYWEKTEHGLDVGRASAPPPRAPAGGGS
jgi:glycosyltransferase XagB